MTRRVARPPNASDPYGVGPVASYAAPILSIVGLVIIGVLTFNLLNGQVPFLGGSASATGSDGAPAEGPARTAAPSNVVIVEEEAVFKGSIVYAKAGNIWVQTADGVTQLTDSGGDSMPSWSPDGEYIHYIQTKDGTGRWPVNGVTTSFVLEVPSLMRVKADGSADPERLANGKFKKGRFSWSYWMRQPVLSPDGKRIALITDAPDPNENNVILQFFDTKTKKIRSAGVSEVGLLGHQDPEWRPDGKYLLYTKNARKGTRGAPLIVRYDPATKKTKAITSAGYVQASYSPDGKYIAATRTSNLGTDIVILDANNGREYLRVTADDRSFGPSWSPAGDAITYLHINGQTVDLRLARLGGSGPDWTIEETIPLTEVSGLDATSRPDWFIPAADLPAPTPTPSAASPDSSDAATPVP